MTRTTDGMIRSVERLESTNVGSHSECTHPLLASPLQPVREQVEVLSLPAAHEGASKFVQVTLQETIAIFSNYSDRQARLIQIKRLAMFHKKTIPKFLTEAIFQENKNYFVFLPNYYPHQPKHRDPFHWIKPCLHKLNLTKISATKFSRLYSNHLSIRLTEEFFFHQ